jgi:hypothetical protein
MYGDRKVSRWCSGLWSDGVCRQAKVKMGVFLSVQGGGSGKLSSLKSPTASERSSPAAQVKGVAAL